MGRRFLHKLTVLLLLPVPFPKWMIALSNPVRGYGAAILFWLQSLMGAAFIVIAVAYAVLGLRYDVLGDLRPAIMLWVVIPFFVVTGLLITLTGWKDYRRIRRTETGLCPNCGYDLRASPERCPECGQLTSSRVA